MKNKNYFLFDTFLFLLLISLKVFVIFDTLKLKICY